MVGYIKRSYIRSIEDIGCSGVVIALYKMAIIAAIIVIGILFRLYLMENYLIGHYIESNWYHFGILVNSCIFSDNDYPLNINSKVHNKSSLFEGFLDHFFFVEDTLDKVLIFFFNILPH